MKLAGAILGLLLVMAILLTRAHSVAKAEKSLTRRVRAPPDRHNYGAHSLDRSSPPHCSGAGRDDVCGTSSASSRGLRLLLYPG